MVLFWCVGANIATKLVPNITIRRCWFWFKLIQIMCQKGTGTKLHKCLVGFQTILPIYIYNIHDMICEECADMIVDMNNLYGSLSKACITHTHTIHPAHLSSAGNLRFIHEQDNFQWKILDFINQLYSLELSQKLSIPELLIPTF